MKTILLPIYNGARSRNFFHNDFYRELAKDKNIRLVVLVPPYKMDFYRREFKEPNLIFEPWETAREPWQGKITHGLAFNILNTASIKTLQKVAYLRGGRWWAYVLKRAFARTFGNWRWARAMVRWLDRFVPLNKEAVGFLDRYRPDAVIASDIAFGPDRIVLRAAKRKGYFTIGAVRSWDNLSSRGILQIFPDKLITHTSIMKREATYFSDMPEKDVVVLGIPHFDLNYQNRKPSKKEFYKNLNIPLGRRLILCAPFFDAYSHQSGLNIVNALLEAIKTGKLPKDIHLLVRYRPESISGENDEAEKKIIATGYATMTYPYSNSFSAKQDGRPEFEYSKEDIDLFFHSIYFSDVTINTISTLTVDAIALDKPVINVRYDGDPNCPPAFSIKNYSDFEHYHDVEKTGCVRVAYTPDELIHWINEYLKNPALDAEGRARAREELIEFMDGQSGKRYAEYIKKKLF